MRRSIESEPSHSLTGHSLTDHSLSETTLSIQSANLQRQVCLKRLGVRQLIDEVMVQLSDAINQQNIATEIDVPPSLTLVADDRMLRSAVFNLVLNAIQAMPLGGELVITAISSGGDVELEVADNGPGLADPRHLLGRIQDAAHSDASGLAVVHRTAQSHGGCVTVTNCPEGGAAFTLHLPAARALRAAA